MKDPTQILEQYEEVDTRKQTQTVDKMSKASRRERGFANEHKCPSVASTTLRAGLRVYEQGQARRMRRDDMIGLAGQASG